jgi:hypothetical protein
VKAETQQEELLNLKIQCYGHAEKNLEDQKQDGKNEINNDKIKLGKQWTQV